MVNVSRPCRAMSSLIEFALALELEFIPLTFSPSHSLTFRIPIPTRPRLQDH